MNSLFNAVSSLALKSTFKTIATAAGADHLAFDEAFATSILIGLYFSIEFANFNQLHKFNEFTMKLRSKPVDLFISCNDGNYLVHHLFFQSALDT